MEKQHKIKIDGALMYGMYSEDQLNLIAEQMKRPQHKRRYVLGIEFSQVQEVEIIKEVLKDDSEFI